jgi:hypothetical protein
MPGLKFAVDASALKSFSKRMAKAQKSARPTMQRGLTEVGDELLSVLASDLAKRTGLGVDQVRDLMTVKRPSASDLSYEVKINNKMFDTRRLGRELPDERGTKGFGERTTGQLVIVVTRKDELVCMECEELEAAGPMPVEVAMAHVPVHPHCRCIIMPYVAPGRKLKVKTITPRGRPPKRKPLTSDKLTGAQPAPKRVVEDMTVRQMADRVLKRTARKIKIELKA